jgi:hypothetical protein
MRFIKLLITNVLASVGFIRRPALKVNYTAEHPTNEDIQAGVIYIVQHSGFPKWAIFRCPRHEEEIIQLSLMFKRRPSWTVKTDWLDRPTIHPSVRQIDGSYSHFWVRGGCIDWCTDSGRGAARNKGAISA